MIDEYLERYGCTFYPEAGRMLTSKDVNKPIVRVLPCKHFYNTDYSYCFWKEQNGSSKVGATSATALAVDEQWVNFKFEIRLANDGYWTTEEELKKHLSTNPKGKKICVHYSIPSVIFPDNIY